MAWMKSPSKFQNQTLWVERENGSFQRYGVCERSATKFVVLYLPSGAEQGCAKTLAKAKKLAHGLNQT